MVGVEVLDGDGNPDGDLASRMLREANDRGLLLLTCGYQGQVVRLIPALVVTPEQVDEAVGLVTEALEKAAAS